MSSSSQVFLRKESVPSQDAIAAICRKAGYGLNSTLLRDSSDSIIAFVKYGPMVTLAQARTQDWVAKAVNDDPRLNVRVPTVYEAFEIPFSGVSIGHIIMEYIDAPHCDENDTELAANAVQTLIGLKAQDAVPGPVGGGLIRHPLFIDWCSNYAYDTVEKLNKHMNYILRTMEDTHRVDLIADSKNGLFLCPSDIHAGNFKKIEGGPVVILDFGAVCFLPPIFFYLAMHKSADWFTQIIAQKIKYPYRESFSNMEAMLSVSGYLALVGPKGFRVHPGFFD